MLNNKGFSNILVISLVLVLLGVGGYFGYSYYLSLKPSKIVEEKKIVENKQETIPSTKPNFNLNLLQKATKVENGYIGVINYTPQDLNLNKQVSYLVLVPNEKKEFKEQDFKVVLKEKWNGNGFIYNNDYVYYITNWRGINRINLKDFKIEELVKNTEGDIRNFKIQGDLIYYIDNSKLYSLNLNGKNIKLIANLPLGVDEIIYISENKIFMQEVKFPLASIQSGGVTDKHIRYDLENKKITEIVKSQEIDYKLQFPEPSKILKMDSGKIIETSLDSTEYNKKPLSNFETNRDPIDFEYLSY